MYFGCYGNFKFPWTYNWEKWKFAFIAISLQIFWRKFFRNVWWVVLYQTYTFCPNLSIWLSWQPKGWICEKYSKLNLEAIWEIKLKLWRNVHSISFYKSIVFIAVAYALWLLWQLRVSIDLLWGKWKLALIAVLLQISWQNVFRIVCWVVLHQA